ncbi:serine protease-like protein 9 [Sarcoptes scabiei]|uniref:limulus clotting factor C n=1 Tax=Sarcoptes scabiei TaxID=52283 RepID=A0A132AJ34_SARSC|nr:serine protease-like protein 9 [Sarcoptes scabiei]
MILLVFLILLFSNNSVAGDRLDQLLSHHSHHCGESLHRPTKSSIDAWIFDENHTTNLESKFDFVLNNLDSLNDCVGEDNDGKVVGRIVGGSDTKRFEFPWQVSLRKFSSKQQRWYHACGGVIIDSEWILTVAHCAMKTQDPEQYRIRIGEHDYSVDEGTELDLNVSKIIIHKDFNLQTIDSDICLMKVSSKIDFSTSSKIRPICLRNDFERNNRALKTSPNNKLICISTGWGQMMYHGKFPRLMQKVCVDLIDQDQCREVYKTVINVTDRMICSGRNGKGTCQGDSGGPLQCMSKMIASSTSSSSWSNHLAMEQNRWSLYGLTSYGIGCAYNQFPSVAANISALRDWIADHLIASKRNDGLL